MRFYLFFLFIFSSSVFANCKPEHYHGFGTGYDGYLELVESSEISNTESLLIWWREGEPVDGCETESCEKKYFDFSVFIKEDMFDKAKIVIRKKQADAYLLVWEDEIIINDKAISVLKMSLGLPNKALSNEIAMEYPLIRKDGRLLYPEGVIELGCGLNLLK